MENINVLEKNYKAVIEYTDDKNITLKSGAKLGIEKPSLDPTLKALRAKSTTTDGSGDIITAIDLGFKSKSAIASFIVGSPQSGNRFFAKYLKTTTSGESEVKTEDDATKAPTMSDKEQKQKVVESVIAFCQDFAFKPDPRCLNNMAFVDDVNSYLLNFMELTNFPADMLEKAKSKFASYEWKALVKTIKSFNTTSRINQRLIIKYGDAGTGKTTDAIAQNPNAVKIVASASADPDDLFTRFEPSKKAYILTELGEAMVNGKPIIIDEANLYNQVCLTRLQGCLDNTAKLTDRGIDINIAEGFKVIMTMNLETNLGKTPLPNPLVSRAQALENYNNHQDLSWVW